MSEAREPGAGSGPSRTSPAVVAVAMVLLAALVWYLNPRQPDLHPAPLDPPTPICRNPGRQFVPSNLTDVRGLNIGQLDPGRKHTALVRLNTTACKCGCNLSVIYCRGLNPACETSKKMAGQIVSEAAGNTAPPAEKKKHLE